jgi:hypothetical protein
MNMNDVVSTLHHLGMLVKNESGSFVLRYNVESVSSFVDHLNSKSFPRAKMECLKWTDSPFKGEAHRKLDSDSSPSQPPLNINVKKVLAEAREIVHETLEGSLEKKEKVVKKEGPFLIRRGSRSLPSSPRKR